MREIRLLAIAGAMVCVLAPARAGVKSYCEAYARNEANVRLTGSAILGASVKPTPEQWAARNQLALAECLARYEPKLELLVRRSAAPVVSTTAVKLVAGSAAWNDYCGKKYTSFNRATGMYTSKSGKQRPCAAPNN